MSCFPEASPPLQQVPRAQVSAGEFLQCPLCPAKLCNRQRLAAHASRVHGLKNELRHYVVGVHCQACLKLFWTRE
eukprot:9009571-Lingulodinium_polyedra.AAC.1